MTRLAANAFYLRLAMQSDTLTTSFLEKKYAYRNRIIIYEALRVPCARIPSFYALPKINKTIVRPPGHPIILGIGAKTEKGSRLVDTFLQHHVLGLLSYIQDTMELLNKFHDIIIPSDSILVSLDAEALYCSIPHKLGISVVEKFLNEKDVSAKPYNAFILCLLFHILTKNVFMFDGSYYLQVQVVAMGICQPVPGRWEQQLFSDDSLSVYLSSILSWYGYIYDIFMVWHSSRTVLQEFVTQLAANAFHLRFTMQSDPLTIFFHDINIFRHGDGTLGTSLFRKPTMGNTIPHVTSANPQPLIRSIPY